MKAYILRGVNDIRYEEADKPVPKRDTVVVRVEAAGICGSDIPRIYRTGAHVHPLIPGHEFSGTVVETGEGADEAWLNKRVGIFPLIPCMECPQCREKRYEMCQHYNYLGSRTDGGFAEYVQVPVWNLLKLPDEVTFEQAAMLEPASVAMHAIRAMGVHRGETYAVCGLGTIGLLMVMMLKAMGAQKVYAMGNKEIQCKLANELGIDRQHFCDTRWQDAAGWLMDVTGGTGVNGFFDCVGKNEVVNLAIGAVAAGGRVMLVGNPASDMHLDRDVYWQILRKQLTLMGTWNSSYTQDEGDDWHFVMQAICEGRIAPERLITHRYSMEELYCGMEIMRDKTEDYVKIMGYGNPALQF